MFQKPRHGHERDGEHDALRRRKSRREQSDRDRGELEPLDVRAEVARDHERDAGSRRGRRRRDRAAAARRGTRAVTRMPSTAKATPGMKSASENGNWPSPGKSAAQDELEHAGGAERPKTVARARPALQRAPGEHDAPGAGTRAGSRAASGRRSPAKTRLRPRCNAFNAKSASAAPSANGKRRRQRDPGPEDGEGPARETRSRPPLLPHDERERERGRADRRDREHLDPDQRCERVVEEAVGDERVAAAVPEVVPEREAVLEQEGALVGVRGRDRPRVGRARRCRPVNVAATAAEIAASRTRSRRSTTAHTGQSKAPGDHHAAVTRRRRRRDAPL